MTVTRNLIKMCSKNSVSQTCSSATAAAWVTLHALGTLQGPGVIGVFLTGELFSDLESPSSLVSWGSSTCLSLCCLFSRTVSCVSSHLCFSVESSGMLERLEVFNLLELGSPELDFFIFSFSDVFLLESLNGRLFPPSVAHRHSGDHPSILPEVFCFAFFLSAPVLLPPFDWSVISPPVVPS